MGFLRRVFGQKSRPTQDRADAVVVSRGPKAVHSPPGAERETFTREIANLLRCKPEEVDLGRDLWQDYGCDELDVLECIQTAEDIWNVSLVPSPYSPEVSEQIRRYQTLASILEAATRAVA
jgi:hypothetical protein